MSEGIGARLRAARERSRLTILQAAEQLHVDPGVLEALEAEDFAALGAPVYVKGHLRHYAELIGESPQALSALQAQGEVAAPPDLTRFPKPVVSPGGRSFVLAVVLLIGFAIAAAAWWGVSLHRRMGTRAARPIPAMVTLRANEPASADRGARVPSEPHSFSSRIALAASLASASASVSASAPAARGLVAPGAPASGLPAGASRSPAGSGLTIVLTYSAPSWTEVRDATGKLLLQGLVEGPAKRKVAGTPPLTVLLGNAPGVTVAVDRRPAAITGFVRPDHTARFQIAAGGELLAIAPVIKGGA